MCDSLKMSSRIIPELFRNGSGIEPGAPLTQPPENCGYSGMGPGQTKHDQIMPPKPVSQFRNSTFAVG